MRPSLFSGAAGGGAASPFFAEIRRRPSALHI